MTHTSMMTEVIVFLKNLQAHLCVVLEAEEEKIQFQENTWQHPTGGGGRTCVLQGGTVFESGGVNFSHVFGHRLPATATLRRPELSDWGFQATGISLVLHPNNPYVPTVHLNLRFFLAEKEDHCVWWFGGGYDLTPYYGFVEDVQHWHQTAKTACDSFGSEIYPRYKKQCDDYFYLKHRQEPRGVGGLFFDDLNHWEFGRCLDFIHRIGNSFIDAYLPIVQRRKHCPYGEREKAFQLYRRGRYVEFNLLYDRGTLFGLQSGGRIESILMSLPPHVTWRYDWQPASGTEEARLYQEFLVPKDWV